MATKFSQAIPVRVVDSGGLPVVAIDSSGNPWDGSTGGGGTTSTLEIFEPTLNSATTLTTDHHDKIVLVDATGADVSIDPGTVVDNKLILIKNLDASTHNVIVTNVDGADRTITPGQSISIVGNTTWLVVREPDGVGEGGGTGTAIEAPNVTGNYFILDNNVGTLSSGTVFNTGLMSLMIFRNDSERVISRLGGQVIDIATGGSFKRAIFAVDPVTGMPDGAPIAQTGALSTSAAGVIHGEITGGVVTLAPGYYYHGLIIDTTAGSTVTFQTCNNNSMLANLIGASATIDLSTGGTSLLRHLQYSNTYTNGFPTLTGAAPDYYSTNLANAICYAKLS